MYLSPGKSKCFSFSFVAKTEDVGKKIEVSYCVCVKRRDFKLIFFLDLPIGDRNRGYAGQQQWPLCFFDLERSRGRCGICP